jgi:hypothetical protein
MLLERHQSWVRTRSAASFMPAFMGIGSIYRVSPDTALGTRNLYPTLDRPSSLTEPTGQMTTDTILSVDQLM